MSEREQTPEEQQKPEGFEVDLGSFKFRATPDNTAAYLHEDEPQFDHLFYTDSGGYLYLFRQKLSNFDDVVEYMKNSGYQVEEGHRATLQDRGQYFELYGYPDIPKRELTPREERRIQFARYLLEHENIIPEDFNTKTIC